MRPRRSMILCCIVAAGCGAERPPAPQPLPPPRAAAPAPSAAPPPAPGAAAALASPASPAPPGSPAPPAAAPAATPFPPPPFAPLHERTAEDGDGKWSPIEAGGRGPVMYRATAHPHRFRRDAYVVVVAFDLGRVDLRLVAGTLDPQSDAVPPERRTGLVPAAEHDDLLAVFNGGFMTRHGRFGVRIGPDTFVPPRPEACTVALYGDRSVRVRTWTELQPTEPQMAAYRQTPPCILEQGAPHPELESTQRPRKWGASESGEIEVRRSALGVDATGRILFYGLGDWITVKALADAMAAAGAADAAQLDINWSYTRFLLFGRPSPGAPLEVTSTLVPKIKHTKHGYVGKPSERDFFYVKHAQPR